MWAAAMQLTNMIATVIPSRTDLLRQHLDDLDSQASCLQNGAEPGGIGWKRPARQENTV